MTLSSALRGVSLAIFLSTTALAGPVVPALEIARDAAAPVLKVSDPDVTGSLGDTRAISSGQTANLRAAVTAYTKDGLASGDAAAQRLADPAARALAEWVAIRSAARDVGFDRIHAFLKRYPTWPAANTVSRRAEEALYYDNATADTVEAFFAGRSPVTDEGKIALAGARLTAGDRRSATALVRDAYRNDPLNEALESDIIKRLGGLLTKADLKYRADRLIYAEDYADGLRSATRAGADVAALARARIAVARKDAKADALMKAVPASVRGDPAYTFARVQMLRRDEKGKEAASLLLQAPRDTASLVSPDDWWTERRMVARQVLDSGDAALAYKIAAGHSAVGDQARMDAEFHAGWIALRFIGDAKTAATHFARLSSMAERPISQSRGAYWQGRAAETLGDKAGAIRFYQAASRYGTTYYGQLARARLGTGDLDLRALPSVSAAARQSFGALDATRAIAMLYDIGERDLARILVGEFANRLQDAQQLTLLGELATKNGDAKAALSIGKSATQRGLPLDMVAFPTGALPSFQTVDNVEKSVVYGIARQESEFNHQAVSHAGARGLMQVMPATAKATAKANGMAFDARRLTTDPAYNCQIGAAHLGELIDRFNGSYIMTFAAYNAGGSRVAEWMLQYGDPRDPRIDPIDWVERIPFSETRNYVQRVMENVQVYRARLGNKTALMIEKDMRRGSVE